MKHFVIFCGTIFAGRKEKRNDDAGHGLSERRDRADGRSMKGVNKLNRGRIPLLGKGGVRGGLVNIHSESFRKLTEPPLAPPLPRRGMVLDSTIQSLTPP